MVRLNTTSCFELKHSVLRGRAVTRCATFAMFKRFVVVLVAVHAAGELVDRFINPEGFLKCCELDEALAVSQDGLAHICRPNDQKNSYLISSRNEISYKQCENRDYCVDEVQSEFITSNTTRPIEPHLIQTSCDTNISTTFNMQYKTFPKCCPPNNTYEMAVHSCVPENDGFNFQHYEGFFYIKPGLAECKGVVVDERISDLDNVTVHENLSISFARLKFDRGDYCFEKEFNSDSYVFRTCRSIGDCKTPEKHGIKCVRKCCPDGSFYSTSPVCKQTFTHGFDYHLINNQTDDPENSAPFGIIHGITCKKYLAPKNKFNYTIDEYGRVAVHTRGVYHELPAQDELYCFEEIDMISNKGLYLILCFEDDLLLDIKFTISKISLILSSICLGLLLVGSFFLPERQTLYGKIRICYCMSLFLAYAFLAYVQFNPEVSNAECVPIGFSVMGSFLAAFTWLNIMCIDIWWTFGSLRVPGMHHRKREMKRFFRYSVYGWSVPIIITSLAVFVKHSDSFPEYIRPNFGEYTCFYDAKTSNYSYYLFFIAPVALLLTCNLVLFIRTIVYCSKVKNEINRMRDHPSDRKNVVNADREKLNLTIRLFIVMGIGWLFEVISSFIFAEVHLSYRIIEMIVDTYNSIQGILTFFVFTMKTKILSEILEKFGWKKSRRVSQISTTTYTTMTSLAKNGNGNGNGNSSRKPSTTVFYPD